MIDARRQKKGVAATCEPSEHGGWVFTAWEMPADGHGEVQSHGGETWGRVDTRPRPDTPLPEETIDRYEICEAWERSQRTRAYAIIHDLYPETKAAMRTRGQLLVLGDPEMGLNQKKKKGEDRDAVAPPTFAGMGDVELPFQAPPEEPNP
jgi:hypothetical protein